MWRRWTYSSAAPRVSQVAAASGGGQSGVGSPSGTMLTCVTTCEPSHPHAGYQSIDTRLECGVRNRASVTSSADWSRGRPTSAGSFPRRYWCIPISATVRAAPSRTAGGFEVAEQVGERVDGAHGEGRDPAEGRLEGGVACRLELGLETGSSASQRRSVFSPTPQRAAAFAIVGSDKSARTACSRTAAVLAP